MLHVDVYALGLDAADLCGADLTGDERILGVILEVASTVRSAMNVDAGTVQTRVGFAGRHQTIVAQTAADRFGDLPVECCSQNVC